MSRRVRLALLLLANGVGLCVVAWNLGADEVLRTAWYLASPDRPAVVFIVMDTVRSDRLSACGHDRPTSPTLDALVAEGFLIIRDPVRRADVLGAEGVVALRNSLRPFETV